MASWSVADADPPSGKLLVLDPKWVSNERGGVAGRAIEPDWESSWEDANDVWAVVVRAELWANWESECDEPTSELADRLDRGEIALREVMEFRERWKRRVNVAAAFISTSTSRGPSTFDVLALRCLLLAFPPLDAFFRLVSLPVRVWARVCSATLE